MYLRVACIFLLFLLSNHCVSQYAKTDYLNYLADHAVFFSNGIRNYQDNGKYGFVYKDLRLSKPIYDTIYSFGNVCIVKRDSVYTILDQNLKSAFSQAIQSIHTYYSSEKNTFVMNIRSTRGFSFEYTVNNSSSWQAQFIGDYYRNPLQPGPYNQITDSIRNAALFPEALGVIKTLFLDRPRREVIPYNQVLYDGKFLKFFPKEGKPFVRKRLGLDQEYYLGASLMEYRNYSDNKHLVIDEKTGDTILSSKFHSYSMVIDGQLYLFNQAYAGGENTQNITIYNQQGQMLSVFVPQTIHGKKCRARIDKGVIVEEIPSKSKKYAHYPLYNIYSAPNLELILENVIHYHQTKDYMLYYSPSRRSFYLLNGNRIIYSFVSGKKQYVDIETIYPKSFPIEPICVNILDSKEQVIESTLISSSGKVLDKNTGNDFGFSLSTDGKVIGVHKRIDHQFAIFSPEEDSLYQFVSKDNLDHVLTKEVLYYSDDDGDRLETTEGKTLLAIGDKQLTFIPVKDDHFVLQLRNRDNSSLYNEHFQLTCEQCILAPIMDAYPIFTLKRDLNEPVFELVDEHLKPISTNRYLAFLKGKEGSMIALLTENYEVEYWDLSERKRY